MTFVLYVYVPAVSGTEVRSLFQSLVSAGFSITHLGKKDPPKKWSGTIEDAVTTILAGDDWTFMRDAKRDFEMTIEIHSDPRWKHSTISASLPEEALLRSLGQSIITQVRSFASILGQSGAGKDQKWQILQLADDCPKELRSKIE